MNLKEIFMLRYETWHTKVSMSSPNPIKDFTKQVWSFAKRMSASLLLFIIVFTILFFSAWDWCSWSWSGSQIFKGFIFSADWGRYPHLHSSECTVFFLQAQSLQRGTLTIDISQNPYCITAPYVDDYMTINGLNYSIFELTPALILALNPFLSVQTALLMNMAFGAFSAVLLFQILRILNPECKRLSWAISILMFLCTPQLIYAKTLYHILSQHSFFYSAYTYSSRNISI